MNTPPWIGHDCLPGQRDGIYVNRERDHPEGSRWTCPVCGTEWVRGAERWEKAGGA